jgi:Uma2 family endonuclease
MIRCMIAPSNSSTTPFLNFSFWVGACEFNRQSRFPPANPQPDLALVRGNKRSYLTRHPSPADFGIVIEVSNSTLISYRTDKGIIYAAAGLPCYWVVNLEDRQIEIYEQPSRPVANPNYASSCVFKSGDSIPLVLDGVAIGTIPVDTLLP